jgi:DNA-binding response OmpR family regulator
MRVLVVHRQKEVTRIIQKQLDPWYVHRAHSGLEGLIATKTQRFDLVIGSLNLPVITGIEMVRSIRLCSFYKNVPVVIMAIGSETPSHADLLNRLNANLLTMSEVYEMQKLVVDPENYVR